MKKKLILLAAILPMVLTGCQTNEKETYTLKDNEILIVECVDYVDSFTTKSIYCNMLSISGDSSRALLKGEFTIKLTYWDFGLDVKVAGTPNVKEADFAYRGNISYSITSYK